MLRSPTPPIEGKSIYHLATETIQDILLYLPLDEKLHEVGLSSKTLFAPTLFYTIDFARKHFQTEVKRREYECIWDFLVSSNIQPSYPTSKVPPIWNALPFTYRTAIYGIILQLADCSITPLLHLSHQLPPIRSWRLQNPERAIEILLKEKGFNPASQNNRALYWSCIKGETAAVKLLMERLENTVDYQEALYHACTSGSPDLLNFLLENPHVDPSADNCRALLKACESSDAKLMTILLEDERVNPNCVDRIISIAVTHGCDVLQTLLDDGRADPAAQNNEAIRVAAKKNLFEEIECLLSDPRVDPKVALPIAAAHGNIDAFYTLMEDSRVNPADFDQSTIRCALKSCTYMGEDQIALLEMLLNDPRVDPTAEDSIVLRNMVTANSAEAILFLLADGRADPAALDNWTIRQAAFLGLRNVVRALLTDSRVDPLVGGDSSALILAIRKDFTDSAKIILQSPSVIPRAKNYGLIVEAFAENRLYAAQLLLDQYNFEVVAELDPVTAIVKFEECRSNINIRTNLSQDVLAVVDKVAQMLISSGLNLNNRSASFQYLCCEWSQVVAELQF